MLRISSTMIFYNWILGSLKFGCRFWTNYFFQVDLNNIWGPTL
jgi:hypothetical protein